MTATGQLPCLVQICTMFSTIFNTISTIYQTLPGGGGGGGASFQLHNVQMTSTSVRTLGRAHTNVHYIHYLTTALYGEVPLYRISGLVVRGN